MIKQCGEKWCLYTKDGSKLLGKHKTEQEAIDQEKAIESQKNNMIKDREIFSVGVHNGDKYTEADLEEMVRAFDALDFKPAIKLGHSKDIGAPAFGYIDNLRKIGGKLVADFIDLPKEIYQAIKEKRYGRVSAEVFWNLKRAGKNYSRAISAVALLGQEIPAVAGLKPLYEYEESGEFEKFSCYEFAMSKNASGSGGENGAGSGENDDLIGAKNMEKDLEKANQEIELLKTQIDDLKKNSATGDDVKKYTNQIDELTKANKVLAEKMLNKEAEEKAASLKVPALRNAIKGLYELALNKPTEKVKVYSVEAKADEEKDIVQVLDGIVSYINEKAQSLFSEKAESDSERSEGFEDVGAEVAKRASEYLAKPENKDVSYSDAVKAVLNKDEALKKAYSAI